MLIYRTKATPDMSSSKGATTFLRKIVIVGLLGVILLAAFPIPSVQAQGVIAEPVARRDLVIDLGEGLTTDAQLTFPAVAEGPFPGVLLIHGSGAIDMDAYFPAFVTGTGKPARVFLQIAEYLSERGFAVLRYNKRGVGLNGTIPDLDVYVNMTFQDLVQDAGEAVEVLRAQPEVDVADITLIGHSEGTWIAPRVAMEDPSIKNIVLMSAGAENLREIIYFQLVDRRIYYAEDTLDSNHDGLLSVQEVYATADVENVYLSPLPPQNLIHNSTGEYEWYPDLDADADGYLNIHEELKPLTIQGFEAFTTAEYPGSKWLQSHFTLETNLAIIGNVSASILILQGEGDTQVPVEQAFLLEHRLTEIDHPDHTLITYPGLGHSFSPVNGWIQPLGPIQKHVLADLAAWLQDPARMVHRLKTEVQTATGTIADLQKQLTMLDFKLGLRTSELRDAEAEVEGLKEQIAALDSTITLRTSELRSAKSDMSELEDELSDANKEISDLNLQLSAQRETHTQLSDNLDETLDETKQEISDQARRIEDLRSESSSLQNTIRELDNQNTTLQLALVASTNLAYIALGVAVIALAAAALVVLRARIR